MASDLQASRPGYRELAAAYEQLASAAERYETIHAADEDAPAKPPQN